MTHEVVIETYLKVYLMNKNKRKKVKRISKMVAREWSTVRLRSF